MVVQGLNSPVFVSGGGARTTRGRKTDTGGRQGRWGYESGLGSSEDRSRQGWRSSRTPRTVGTEVSYRGPTPSVQPEMGRQRRSRSGRRTGG